MTVSIFIFSYRKASVTPEEFRTQTEEVLVPLLKEITGEHFPLSHTRRYIQHTAGAEIGADAIAELTFTDQAALGAFIGALKQPGNDARITEVEGKFTDSNKTSIVTVTETSITKK
ncbi:hypothetical protein DL767_004645 [Monosporascus sp. MG133]|nr:hypothetical protein DL767_004645 [Monosporascus sp. MG133]